MINNWEIGNMELSGVYEISGSERDIWNVLHSPDRLKNIVPGCTAIIPLEDGRLKAMATLRIGPMKVNFEGSMEFEDIARHTNFRISGQGEGGPAGFIRGTADIHLAPLGNGRTSLTYTAHSDIGGKLASLGGRLLEAISRKNIDSFFQDLQQELSGPALPDDSKVVARSIPTATTHAQSSILPKINTVLLALSVIALWVIALK
jgi:carbon monoxide dehydrogenase subunit G